MPQNLDDLLNDLESEANDQLSEQAYQQAKPRKTRTVDDVLNEEEANVHQELSGDTMSAGEAPGWWDTLRHVPEAISSGKEAAVAQMVRGSAGLADAFGAVDPATLDDVNREVAQANQNAQMPAAFPGAQKVADTSGLATSLLPWLSAGGVVGGGIGAGNRRLDVLDQGGSEAQADLLGGAQGALDIALPLKAGELVGPVADRAGASLADLFGGRVADSVAGGTAGAIRGTAAGASLPLGNVAEDAAYGDNRGARIAEDLKSIPASAATLGVLGGLHGIIPRGMDAPIDPQALDMAARAAMDPANAQMHAVDPVTGHVVTDPELIAAIAEEQGGIAEPASATSAPNLEQPESLPPGQPPGERLSAEGGVRLNNAESMRLRQQAERESTNQPPVDKGAETATHPAVDAETATKPGKDDLASVLGQPTSEVPEHSTPDAKAPSNEKEILAQGETGQRPAPDQNRDLQKEVAAAAQPTSEATIPAKESAAPKPDLAQEIRNLVDEIRSERAARAAPKPEPDAGRKVAGEGQVTPDIRNSEIANAGTENSTPTKSIEPSTETLSPEAPVSVMGMPANEGEAHRSIRDVVAKAKEPGNEPHEISYQPVSADEAIRIKEKTGLDVADHSHSVDAFGVRHVLKKHGKEADPYLNVTEDDFAKIPDIISSPDSIERTKTKAGVDAITYSKRSNGVTHFVEEVRKGRKRLALKTMYKVRSKESEPGASSATAEAGRPLTSETLPRTTPPSVAETGGQGKQGEEPVTPEVKPIEDKTITEQERQERIDLAADDLAKTDEGKGLSQAQLRKRAAATVDQSIATSKIRILGHGGTPSVSSVSEHLWGDKSFVKNDVKPTAVGAAKGLKEAADDIQRAFAPQTRTKQAKQMAGLAREHGADLARRADQADHALHEAKKFFDRKKAPDNFAFIDRMERGEQQPTEALQTIADTMRGILDTRREEIRALGKGKLDHFIEDYFPHLWKDPEKATNAFSQAAGRRPLEGGKSFLKKRSIPTFKDGIDAGLEPVSENPVDLVLLKAREMDKYLLGQRMMAEMKAKDLAQFVRATDKAPEGFAKINDSIAQVYGPPTIEMTEHVNRARYDALEEVAKNLGVTHERKAKVGKGVLGYSVQGGDYIASKFASDLSVIAHEISHQLDHKFDLQTLFMKNPDKATRGAMAKELRALADLHEYKKEYFRKAEEKMASILEAYVAAPERFQEVAPTVWTELHKFMDAHAEMHPLRDMKQSLASKKLTTEVAHGGLLKYGEYHAPEAVATLINNYLSPGLRGKSGIFRAYLGAGNFLNQFQLGASAFHLGFTSLDAAISKTAIAFKHLGAGSPGEAAKAAVQVPIAPLTTMLAGSKLLREWYKPGSQGEEMAKIVDGMMAAGGRARMDSFYQTNVAQNMMTAFRKGNVMGGVLRIPGAAIDLMSKPIMEYIVPRQKMGVFVDMARQELANLPEGASRDQVREAMGRAWDSVDNRMGQLVYDNLFWNKTIKDLSMASVRSVGWNLGTIREIGGGLIDTAKAVGNAARLRRPEFTHRMAYTAALPLITGIIGAITQRLKTGQGPDELKDYFFPKTSEKDENGHDIRLNMPSYMKDVYHYQHDPVGAVTGKLHPLISTVADMLRNKDFFGTEIRNADDPMVKQATDVATFLGKQFEPMGVRNFTEDRNAGMTTGEKAASFIGVTKASKYLSQTKAEQEASALSQQKYHGEPMSPEVLQLRRQVLTKLRSDDQKTRLEAQKQLDQLVTDRKMTKRQGHNLVEQSLMSRLEYQVNGLSVADAMRVWRVAEPEEQAQIRDEIESKILKAASIDADQKRALVDELTKAKSPTPAKKRLESRKR